MVSYEGISRVLLFRGYFLGSFLLVTKYFLGSSEIPNSADPCAKSTLWVPEAARTLPGSHDSMVSLPSQCVQVLGNE